MNSLALWNECNEIMWLDATQLHSRSVLRSIKWYILIRNESIANHRSDCSSMILSNPGGGP